MTSLRRHLPFVALSLLLFIAAFAFLLPGINQTVNIYDEGIIVYSAVRIIDGHVLYRDFWSIYTPGQFYVLAGLYKLFGPSIMVERLWDTAARAFLALVTFWLVTRLSSRRTGLLAWVAITAWVGYYTYSFTKHWVFNGYPVWQAITLCLLSILLMMLYFERRDRRWLVGSGVALGVGILFRHDFGIYSGVGQGLALVLHSLLAVDAPQAFKDKLRHFWRAALPFGIGALVIVGPVALYFIAQAPLNELIYNLFTFPTSVFPRYRYLPYPPLELPDALPFYLPFVVYAVGAVLAVLLLRKDRANSMAYALAMVMIIVFGLTGFNQARVRSDVIHTPAFFLPSVIMLAALVGGITPLKRYSPDYSKLFTSLAALVMVFVIATPAGDRLLLISDRQRMNPPITHTLPRAQGALVSRDLVQVAQFLRNNTDPQDRIYVGITTHDRIVVNEPMLYFLAERHSATRYHELHPGVATTAPVQQEIVNDLELYKVEYLVLSSQFEGWKEPNESAISSGVTILDDYIRSRYGMYMQYGPHLIWRRQ